MKVPTTMQLTHVFTWAIFVCWFSHLPNTQKVADNAYRKNAFTLIQKVAASISEAIIKEIVALIWADNAGTEKMLHCVTLQSTRTIA